MPYSGILPLGMLFFVAVTWAEAPDCGARAGNDDQRLTELLATQHAFDPTVGEADYEQLAERVLARFAALWCDRDYGGALADADDAVVRLRLRAVQMAAFHDQPDWVLARLRAAVAQAHARGLAGADAVRDLLAAYQAADRYEEAREVRAEYAGLDLPDVPRRVPPAEAPTTDARLVWRAEQSSGRMVGEWQRLAGAQLLVVTSPACGFCREAVQALLSDETLAPLMRERALWLAQAHMNNRFDALAAWNERHPDAPTLLVDDPRAWPVASFASTPRFHFLRDGEIVHTLAGWRGGSASLSAIADGFQRLDLLDVSDLPGDAFAYADRPAPARGCPERDEARDRIRGRALIHTRDDLERHLAELEAGADSPLGSLSTEGRKRFIDSMRFGADGDLLGFGYGELEAELEPGEIYRLTALFGHQYHFAGLLFDPDLLSEEEQALRAMLNCRMSDP